MSAPVYAAGQCLLLISYKFVAQYDLWWVILRLLYMCLIHNIYSKVLFFFFTCASIFPRSGGHLRLRPRQGGRALVPGGCHHLRDQEERRRLVRGRDERHHGPLPGQLRRVHHALRRLNNPPPLWAEDEEEERDVWWGREKGEGGGAKG